MKDLVIIGGGPGGYVAAIRAAQLDLDVTLIEKNKIGGTCLNVGCIPTKTYVATSNLMKKIKNSKRFGIEFEGEVNINFNNLVKRKNRVVNRLVKGIEYILKKRKVEIINETGKILDKNTVIAGDNEIKTRNIVIATGSKPIIPEQFKIDDFTMDSAEALDLKKKPEHVIVVGAGVIGCEFASIWANMGIKVSLIEMKNRILPFVDKEISKKMERIFKKKKVDIYTGSPIKKVDDKTVILENGEEITADKMLLAIGRKPVLDEVGIDGVEIELDNDGFIKVNEKMQTNVENIYAIGDILNTAQLAHVASKEGVVAVENMKGIKSKINYNAVPWTIFTDPEVAYVGRSDENNKQIGKFPFRANGKALGLNETDGFVKIIADSDDKIIGMQIMGPHASDLIHEGAVSIHNNLKLEDIADTIHAHPTLSESVVEAAEDALGKVIHIV
ncbi:MAG TPA: dihydrolipoyl dehydrogenase [Candidatus Mcinerneyibacterium sp.]|nr:dihydrolipoyl dehydrogenase [Candidatus Mcinerneyibacterium sp.]